MADSEHQEWLEDEKKRRAELAKQFGLKKTPKKKVGKETKRSDEKPKKWSEAADDDEYYE